MKPHGLYLEDENGVAQQQVAWVNPAKQEDVDLVLSQPVSSSVVGSDGRSPWVWVRMQNGDLMLATFPQGDTYMTVSDGGVCDFVWEADAVQQELEHYSPVAGKPMSDGLLKRLVAETDDDRLTDDMRAGRHPAGLWVAWLRS